MKDLGLREPVRDLVVMGCKEGARVSNVGAAWDDSDVEVARGTTGLDTMIGD